MEEILPLVMPFGLASVLAVLCISLTKIVIVWMAIRGVEPQDRAEVLRAVSLLFGGDKSGRKDQPPTDSG